MMLILFESESEEWKHANQKSLFSGDVKEPASVTALILDLLADGRPKTLDWLAGKAAEKNFLFGPKSPMRTLNAGLLSLQASKRVERLGSNVWRVRK